MELVKTSIGTVEIASPMFAGPITTDAARELAARLIELAEVADQLTREQ